MSLPRSLRSLHSGLLKNRAQAFCFSSVMTYKAADARAWKREKGGHKLLGLRYNKTYVVKSCERTHIWAWTYSLGRLGPKESV